MYIVIVEYPHVKNFKEIDKVFERGARKFKGKITGSGAFVVEPFTRYLRIEFEDELSANTFVTKTKEVLEILFEDYSERKYKVFLQEEGEKNESYI